MTTSEIHTYIDSLYPDPIYKEWTPSEYDQKYYTPKKIAKMKEKEDAKIKIKFDKDVGVKRHVHKVMDDIAAYPTQIMDLFYSTIVNNIDYLKKCHEKYLAVKARLEAVCPDARAIARSLSYEMKKTTYDWSPSGRRISKTKMVVLNDEEWNKFVNDYKGEFVKLDNGEYDWLRPAKQIENPKEFMGLVIELYDAYDRDELAMAGDDAYANAIIHMANNLSDIIDEIKKCFNGNKPTKCLTDAHWGYKGEFCGILTDDVNKISFKSFSAGGYNIQKYHFRFKITKLK